MSQRGQQSTAHEYDKRDQCIHCCMYRSNVEKLSHDCKPAREMLVDRELELKNAENKVTALEGD